MDQWISDHLFEILLVGLLLIWLPVFLLSSRAESKQACKESEYKQWEKEHGVQKVRKRE